MKILTDTEKLELAVELLDKRGLDMYALACEKRELGCPDGICEACLVAECAYLD